MGGSKVLHLELPCLRCVPLVLARAAIDRMNVAGSLPASAMHGLRAASHNHRQLSRSLKPAIVTRFNLPRRHSNTHIERA